MSCAVQITGHVVMALSLRAGVSPNVSHPSRRQEWAGLLIPLLVIGLLVVAGYVYFMLDRSKALSQNMGVYHMLAAEPSRVSAFRRCGQRPIERTALVSRLGGPQRHHYLLPSALCQGHTVTFT